jgi:hypothetical protein
VAICFAFAISIYALVFAILCRDVTSEIQTDELSM